LPQRNSLLEDLTRRNEEIIIEVTKVCNLAKIALRCAQSNSRVASGKLQCVGAMDDLRNGAINGR
jgi:hypothetical protein